jgi:hypothetical protein
MNSNAQQAADLLKHYFRKLAEKSGMDWTSDNDTEIENVIEYLLDATQGQTDELIEAALADHDQASISHRMGK